MYIKFHIYAKVDTIALIKQTQFIIYFELRCLFLSAAQTDLLIANVTSPPQVNV